MNMTRPASSQTRSVESILNDRRSFDTLQARFEALVSDLTQDTKLHSETLQTLEHRVRGAFGTEADTIGGHMREHLWLWAHLWDHFPEYPILLAFHADTLLLFGEIDAALGEFLTAFGHEPELVFHFGGEIADYMEQSGPERLLEYELILVRAALADNDQEEAARVLGMLLEKYRNDPDRLRRVRGLAFE